MCGRSYVCPKNIKRFSLAGEIDLGDTEKKTFSPWGDMSSAEDDFRPRGRGSTSVRRQNVTRVLTAGSRISPKVNFYLRDGEMIQRNPKLVGGESRTFHDFFGGMFRSENQLVPELDRFVLLLSISQHCDVGNFAQSGVFMFRTSPINGFLFSILVKSATMVGFPTGSFIKGDLGCPFISLFRFRLRRNPEAVH